ncbi:MAG: hypothetical protein HY376_02200 [Candidatus Blackburnbacteria bacterium]|nr:hypothetical protein [Candidatus Blackburnbacteria bacterium]
MGEKLCCSFDGCGKDAEWWAYIKVKNKDFGTHVCVGDVRALLEEKEIYKLERIVDMSISECKP